MVSMSSSCITGTATRYAHHRHGARPRPWIGHGKKKQVVYDFIDHVGLEWMDSVEAVACDMNSDFQGGLRGGAANGSSRYSTTSTSSKTSMIRWSAKSGAMSRDGSLKKETSKQPGHSSAPAISLRPAARPLQRKGSGSI